MTIHLTAVCVGMAAFICTGIWAALRSADHRLGAEAPGGGTAAVAFAAGGPQTVVRDEPSVAAPRRDADEAAPLNDRGISDTDVRAWCRQEGENFLRVYEVGASIKGWLRRPTRGELAYTLAHADARFDIANHLERGNLTRSGLAKALEQGRLARERMNVRPKRKRAYAAGREDALLDIAFQLRKRTLPPRGRPRGGRSRARTARAPGRSAHEPAQPTEPRPARDGTSGGPGRAPRREAAERPGRPPRPRRRCRHRAAPVPG